MARGQRRQGCRLIVASVGVGKGAHCPAGRKGCARGSMPASAGGACACGMRVRTLVRGSPKASPRDDDVRPTLFCFDSPPRLEECWRDRWKLGNLLGPWSFCSCLRLVVVSKMSISTPACFQWQVQCAEDLHPQQVHLYPSGLPAAQHPVHTVRTTTNTP